MARPMLCAKGPKTLVILIVWGIFWLIPASHPLAEPLSETPPVKVIDEDTSPDEAEFSRLLQIVDKYTEIATRSKLNADYVPGMVTVLNGKDLLTRGVRDVGEALRLVPGMEVISGNFGSISVSVRGLPETYGYASTMLMLNGVPVNNVFSGNYYPFLGIPIEQVERIEVVRGPGSAVHGGYANTGVINIITRTKGDSIYGDTGSYATYGAGGLLSWSDPAKDLRVSLNLAGRNTDGADIRSGPDKLYSYDQGNISNAPGPANEERFTHSAIMDLAYKDFSFFVQYLNSGHGDYFGSDNALPPDSEGIAYRNENWIIELNQGVRIRPALKAGVKLGYLAYEQNTADRVMLYPPGFFTPDYTYPYGMEMAFHYTEHRYYGAVNLAWDGWERHRLFTELTISQTYQGNNTWRGANYDIDTFEPSPTNTMQRFNNALIGKDRERRVTSIVAQDEISVSDNLDITAGLRFDSYNDMDDSISPRLAGVWRLSQKHIFKAQYAQAYMPPSFLQLYQNFGTFSSVGNPQLKPQTSDNYELGYIYRGINNVSRLTLFYSELKDRIVLHEMWINEGGARLTGAELELEQSLLSTLKLDGNISYAHTEDSNTGEALPGTANWLGNLGISYKALSNLVLNAQYRYVGEQNREPQDTRDKLNAFQTVDLTASLRNLFHKGLTLRAGIKNLLDADVRYAAPADTYPEDYPQPGRSWWCEIAYSF